MSAKAYCTQPDLSNLKINAVPGCRQCHKLIPIGQKINENSIIACPNCGTEHKPYLEVRVSLKML